MVLVCLFLIDFIQRVFSLSVFSVHTTVLFYLFLLTEANCHSHASWGYIFHTENLQYKYRVEFFYVFQIFCSIFVVIDFDRFRLGMEKRRVCIYFAACACGCFVSRNKIGCVPYDFGSINCVRPNFKRNWYLCDIWSRQTNLHNADVSCKHYYVLNQLHEFTWVDICHTNKH